MGIQDRDYYREWWKNKDKPAKRFVLPLPRAPRAVPPFLAWLFRAVVVIGWGAALLWAFSR